MDAEKKQPPKASPGMDAVLLRMLNTPPTPHPLGSVKAPKPKKQAEKKA